MVLALIMREMKWRFLVIPYTNRRYVEMLWLERRLSHNLAKFKLDVQKFIDEHPGEGVLMTKFDIRQFKLLNKILGKEVGNTVLITIAAALAQETKIKGYCRAHDDEFYVFLCCSTSEELDKIRTSVWNQFYKCMGPGFSYPMEVIEGHYFMSFDDCQNAAEALVRWEKEGKLIPPNDFIPILEQKGLITKLDFYVLEQVCRKMQSWKNEGRELIDFLRQVGCDKVQGYYFTRPVPAESFWEGTRGAG